MTDYEEELVERLCDAISSEFDFAEIVALRNAVNEPDAMAIFVERLQENYGLQKKPSLQS